MKNLPPLASPLSHCSQRYYYFWVHVHTLTHDVYTCSTWALTHIHTRTHKHTYKRAPDRQPCREVARRLTDAPFIRPPSVPPPPRALWLMAVKRVHSAREILSFRDIGSVFISTCFIYEVRTLSTAHETKTEQTRFIFSFPPNVNFDWKLAVD